jgi:hypothetical protein
MPLHDPQDSAYPVPVRRHHHYVSRGPDRARVVQQPVQVRQLAGQRDRLRQRQWAASVARTGTARRPLSLMRSFLAVRAG